MTDVAVDESIAGTAAAGGAVGTRALPGFDALRGCLTLLVVLHHTAITYGAIGGWYVHERMPDRSLASALLVFFCTVNQAYFMGLFFLLAGYFTPAALERKGPLRFIGARLLRLGVPILFYGYLLGPLTIALAQTAHGADFGGTLMRLWGAATFEIGPLWFAFALLLFALSTVIRTRIVPPEAPDATHRPFPSNRTLALAAIATGAAAFLLRQVWPVGVNVLCLQLGYFASYVVLYGAGRRAARWRWLERLPAAQVRFWWRIALLALPVLPAVHYAGRVVPALRDLGFDLVYAFWEPFVAWGAILFLLDRFRRRFARLDGAWRALGRRAYAIYLIHPPILVGVALAWSGIAAPALVKFALTGAVSCVMCFVAAGWLLRVPAAARVL